MGKNISKEVEEFRKVLLEVASMKGESLDKEAAERFFTDLSGAIERFKKYVLPSEKSGEGERVLKVVLSFFAKNTAIMEAAFKEHERQYLSIKSVEHSTPEEVLRELVKEWEFVGGNESELIALKTMMSVGGLLLLYALTQSGKTYSIIQSLPEKERQRAEGILFGWLLALASMETGILGGVVDLKDVEEVFKGGDYIA